MGSGDVRDTSEVRPRVREDAVQIVREAGKPIARVARDLGINPWTLGNLGGPGPGRAWRGGRPHHR